MPSPPIRYGTGVRASAGSSICRPALPPDLLAPLEIDAEILPVSREHRRAEAAQPALHKVVLEAEYRRQHRHEGPRKLGHPSRGGDLLGRGRAGQNLLRCAVVLGQVEQARVDPPRLLAVELEQLGIA